VRRERQPSGRGARGRAAATFLATTLAGLEGVLADEAATKLPRAAIREITRGKVYLSLPDPASPASSPAPPAGPPPLFALRTADNLYRVLARFRAGPHRADLAGVRDATASLDLRPFLPPPPGRRPTFYVNASRAGRHTYSRFDLAAAATAGLIAGHPTWREGDPTEHDLELRLDLSDAAAVLSLRLTPPSFRFRGARAFSPAALRPTVAHALVWLSRPAPDDRFLDPFCGSGTILAERLPYPARRLIGGDPSPVALAAARTNLLAGPESGGGAPPPYLARWDARRLPLRPESVDAAVSNPPFGRQVLTPDDVAPLYRDFARELGRVLAPGGRAVLLTDQVQALHRALAGAGLRGESRLTLSLKGLHPQVIFVTRP
jgi:tRNA (guanine6-N2)-methyltransferase